MQPEPEVSPATHHHGLRLFLVLGSLMGGALALLTPPVQMPDEQMHLARSYLITEGQWMMERGPDRLGAHLPTALKRLFLHYDHLPFRPENKAGGPPPDQLRRDRIDPSDRTFVNMANGYMTPVGYLPQAAAMACGRLFSSSPLVLLYLGRLGNLAFWLALVGWSLYRAPSRSWLLVWLALAPMSIFQAASASYDVTINALTFVSLTLAWRGLGARDLRSARACYVPLALAVLLIALCKPNYIPLLGLLACRAGLADDAP